MYCFKKNKIEELFGMRPPAGFRLEISRLLKKRNFENYPKNPNYTLIFFPFIKTTKCPTRISIFQTKINLFKRIFFFRPIFYFSLKDHVRDGVLRF